MHARDAADPSLDATFVTLGDARLRVATRGSGRALLFLHGSPGCLEDLGPSAEALLPSFRITSYDRPGHGLSADTGRYSLAHNAEVAERLLDHLGLSRAIVVGHSYGGAAALALALRAPQRISACVVLDSALYRRVRPMSPLHKVFSRPLLGSAVARMLPRSAVQKEIARRLQSELQHEPPVGFVRLRQELWATPKVTHALACEIMGEDAELAQQSPAYPRISVPLYAVAQRDQPERRASAERLGREARATVELVAASAHYVQYDAADAVLAMIRRAAAES